MKHFPPALEFSHRKNISKNFLLELKTLTEVPKNTLSDQHCGWHIYIPSQHYLTKEVLTVLRHMGLNSIPRGEISVFYRYTIQTLWVVRINKNII